MIGGAEVVIRSYLSRLNDDEARIKADKALIMEELLDTRRQITREDILRKTLLEGESSPAPCDLDQIH